jgi:mannose-1-phosphate guanylyltransferase
MDRHAVAQPQSLDPVESEVTGSSPLWAIVLAGGEGLRLRPLTRLVCGDDRPKQYARLFGSRSLLRQTLDRVALAIPPERTIVVAQRRHARFAAAEFGDESGARFLVQPEDRGTAAGILFPAHRIVREEPTATVAIFPSDHFILEGRAFMAHVANVTAFVDRHPQWLVLLGAPPTELDAGYGWVEPGATLGRIGAEPIWRVRRFWEKPSEEIAAVCLAKGCLWNTFVLVARATTLLAAAERFLPAMNQRLARLARFEGANGAEWAIEEAYAGMPTTDFSRSILESCPPSLAVAKLPALTWCDLGTPERVLSTLKRVGASGPWPSSGLPTRLGRLGGPTVEVIPGIERDQKIGLVRPGRLDARELQ